MSDVAPALLDLARRHTRGEASPRRHQASRARVLDQLGARRSSPGTTFTVIALVLGGTGALAFAGVKEFRSSMPSANEQSISTPSAAPAESPAPTHSGQAPSDDGEGVKLQVTPEYATLYWDDKKLGENPSSFRFKPDNKVHKVRAEAPGHTPKTQLVVMDTPYVLVEMQLTPLPIALGPITSSSSVIDADEIGTGLRDAFQACYTSALDEAPTLSGKATVMIHLAENGKVETVDVTDKEGLNAPVTTCLASVAADLHFRVTNRGFVKIPLVFRVK